MGMAEIAVALWARHYRHNPANPRWINRDRFVLSNGHGSMLLYALLHLTGPSTVLWLIAVLVPHTLVGGYDGLLQGTRRYGRLALVNTTFGLLKGGSLYPVLGRLEGPLTATGRSDGSRRSVAFNVHAVRVAVHPASGEVRVLDSVQAFDPQVRAVFRDRIDDPPRSWTLRRVELVITGLEARLPS